MAKTKKRTTAKRTITKTRKAKPRKVVKQKEPTLSEILKGKVEEAKDKLVAIVDDTKEKIEGLIKKSQKLAKTHCPKGMKFIGKFRTDIDKEIKRLKKELKKAQGEISKIKVDVKSMSSDLRSEYKKVMDVILHDHFFTKVMDMEKVKGMRDNLSRNVEGQLTRMRSALGIPQNDDVTKLNRQINTLARKVHNLSAR